MAFGVVAGIALVLALIVGVGLLSGRKVKNAKDFLSGGGKAGPLLVCGSILGSLVGSQATIGTAQLAFHYGLSAWWFTLGSGVGCLALAFGYEKKLRSSGCITETQIIAKEYGSLSGSLASALCSIGIFISILAQTVACAGLVTVLFPDVPFAVAAFASMALMCVYVIFGGAWGAGMGGVIKLLLLCMTSVLGLAVVLHGSGGADGLWERLVALFTDEGVGAVQVAANGIADVSDAAGVSHRFLNLVSRGVAKDLGSALSLLLGVLSTQTYAQAIWSGKTDLAAKRGALLGALLVPPLGISGVSIGLFMRSRYLLRAEATALIAAGLPVPELPVLESTIQVFPTFVLRHLPPLVAGIVLGTLLITVVGGGAGLALGMATILTKDILKKLVKKPDDPRNELLAVRCTIGGILFATAAIAVTVPNSTINDLGFLSMGLRASVVFLPLTLALWLPGRVDRRWILVSMVAAPCSILLVKLCRLPVDSLFMGVFVSAALCAAGYVRGRRELPCGR